MRCTAALAIVGLCTAARADSVTNAVYVNSTQAAASDPRSTLVTDALHAGFGIGDDWTVGGGLNLTLPGATTQFGDRGDAVTLFAADVDWAATDNLSLALSLDYSPKSTQFAGTVIGLRTSGGAESTANAELRSRTAELGAGLAVSWDTLGLSNLEWSFDVGVDFSHYDIDQGISAVRSTLTLQQVQQQAAAYCLAHPRLPSCARGLQTALTLDFERISATALATLFVDTDVSLSADWYAYNQDPSQVGYFGLASQGRAPSLPIAPLQYLIRPEVLHRFGDFSARAWLQAGEYVAGTGSGTAGIGLKLQYRFTKAWRAWVTASGQRGVDAAANVARSGTVSVGVGYRW